MVTTIKRRDEQLAAMSNPEVFRRADLLKQGSAPSSTKGYEQALARLGLTLVSEQSPELMPYLVGFQLLDKSDEGDFACGFFIFDVNGVIIDAPVFLIDGKVKGIQMLFLREQGIFMPAQSEVIKYIMTRHDQTLGETSYGEKDRRPNRASPNFQMFSDRNRYLQKVGEYPDFFDAWGRQSGAFESFCSIVKSDKTECVKTAAFDGKRLPDALDWVELLETPKTASILRGWCESSPLLSQKIAERIGEDWFEKTGQFYQKRAEFLDSVRADALFTPGVLDLNRQSPQSIPKFAAFENVGKFPADVPGRDVIVAEYMKRGAVFFDDREPGTAKIAMSIKAVQTDKQWSAPMASGVYTVPLLTGDSVKVFAALPNNVIPIGYDFDDVLLIDVMGNRAAKVSKDDLAVESSKDAREALNDPMNIAKSLPEIVANQPTFSPSSLGSDDIVVIVDSKGNVTEPLCIDGGSEDGGYEVCRPGLKSQGRANPYGDVLGETTQAHTDYHGRIRKIIVKPDTAGQRMQRVSFGDDDSYLSVPSDARMLKINSEPKEENRNRNRVETFMVVPMRQVSEDNFGKLASFEIKSLTPRVFEIDGVSMVERKAAAFLMTSGVRKESAFNVIDASKEQPGRKLGYAVLPEQDTPELWQVALTPKLAIARGGMQGDPDYQFPQPSEGLLGVSDGHFPVPEEAPVSERLRSTSMELADQSQPPWSSEQTPYRQPDVYGDGVLPSGVQETAEDPSAVFENSLFSSLVEHADPETDRERLLSGLLRSCDDVGRSLFLAYAHGDEYAAAYGLDDAEDLEERLLRVLESSGNLMVSLLNRSISSGDSQGLAVLLDT